MLVWALCVGWAARRWYQGVLGAIVFGFGYGVLSFNLLEWLRIYATEDSGQATPDIYDPTGTLASTAGVMAHSLLGVIGRFILENLQDRWSFLSVAVYCLCIWSVLAVLYKLRLGIVGHPRVNHVWHELVKAYERLPHRWEEVVSGTGELQTKFQGIESRAPQIDRELGHCFRVLFLIPWRIRWPAVSLLCATPEKVNFEELESVLDTLCAGWGNVTRAAINYRRKSDGLAILTLWFGELPDELPFQMTEAPKGIPPVPRFGSKTDTEPDAAAAEGDSEVIEAYVIPPPSSSKDDSSSPAEAAHTT
jgi:hypothetical protein